MDITSDRKVPRPFSLHWGKGLIMEEATHIAEYHRPTQC